MKLDDVKIRSLIYTKHTTQTALSDRAGVTRMTLNSICNGKSCNEATARKIADALDVQIDDIKK